MVAWLLALFQWIFSMLKTLWSSGSNAIKTVWTAGGDAAGAVLTSAVEWFKDDDVNLGKKLAAVAGVGYLVAPDFTSDVLTNAVEGVGDTVTGVVNTTDDVITNFFSTTTGKVVLIGGGLLLATMILKES